MLIRVSLLVGCLLIGQIICGVPRNYRQNDDRAVIGDEDSGQHVHDKDREIDEIDDIDEEPRPQAVGPVRAIGHNDRVNGGGHDRTRWESTTERDHLFGSVSGTGHDVNRELNDDDRLEHWIWNKEEYPNPILTPRYCRRNYASNICDPDDILKKSDAKNIEKLIHRIGADRDCYCPSCPVGKHGLSVGVALMAAVFRPHTPRENIEEFAEYTRKKWHLGTCSNDLLIVIAVKDQQIYTSLGEKAKELLSNNVTKEIYEAAKPYLANGQYYEGIESMVKNYNEVLYSIEEEKRRPTTLPPPQKRNEDENESNLALILGLTFGLIVLFLIIALIGWYFYQRNRRRQAGAHEDDWQSLWSTMTWGRDSKQRVAPVSEQEPQKKAAYDPVTQQKPYEDIPVFKAAPVHMLEDMSEDEDEEENVNRRLSQDIIEPITTSSTSREFASVTNPIPGGFQKVETEKVTTTMTSRTAKTIETEIE